MSGYWIGESQYHLSFRPPGDNPLMRTCTEVSRHPFAAWPGTGEAAIFVARCPAFSFSNAAFKAYRER